MQVRISNIGLYSIGQTSDKRSDARSCNVSFSGNGLNIGSFMDFGLNPMNKFQDFTIDEYNRLNKHERNYLRRMSNEYNNGMQEEYLNCHDKASKLLKRSLDERFGEGEYVVVSIGRSPSSISKALGYRIGEDNIKMLPMSDARRFDIVDDFSQLEGIDKLRGYLDSIGLSREDIETSGKNYVIVDYCESGRSLRGAKKLLESDEIWSKQDNVYAADIVDLVDDVDEEYFDSIGIDDKKYFVEDLSILLSGCLLKKFSTVDRCEGLDKTADAVIKSKNYSKDVKYFWFSLLDRTMTNP